MSGAFHHYLSGTDAMADTRGVAVMVAAIGVRKC